MSYDIIYGKQFVHLRRTGEVIPMLLMGSNNCFDVDRNGRCGRRARSWSNLRYYNRQGKISEKPEAILKSVDAELRRRIRDRHFPKEDKPADVRNRFGYFASIAISGRGTRGTSFNAYRSQFSNGIKNAMTIEELAAFGIYLYFHGYTSGDHPSDGMPQSIDLKTEAEYFAELRKWRFWLNGKGRSFWLSFHPHSDEQVLRRIRAATRKTPREKTSIEQDHYFVLTDGYNTLVRYTSRGYRYSFSKTGGKRFRIEKEAETYRQHLVRNGRYKADIWKVKRIEGLTTFVV